MIHYPKSDIVPPEAIVIILEVQDICKYYGKEAANRLRAHQFYRGGWRYLLPARIERGGEKYGIEQHQRVPLALFRRRIDLRILHFVRTD